MGRKTVIPADEPIISMSNTVKAGQVKLTQQVVFLDSEGILHKEFTQDHAVNTVLHRGPQVFDGGCQGKMHRQVAYSGLASAS